MLTLLLGVALCADMRIDKRDLPKMVDVTSRTLFTEFPGTLCLAQITPPVSFLVATPVICSTKKKAPILPGGFSNTTCFMLESIVRTFAQLKVTCFSDDYSRTVSQSIAVTIVDAAPVCRNTTIRLSSSGSTKFFLRADDPDDDNILFHIRNKSVVELRGKLRYCEGCNGDQQSKETSWKNYSDLVEDGQMHKFSRMFSYEYLPPTNGTYHEVLYYSARDISDLECPSDGEVHFVKDAIEKPVIVPEPSQLTAFINRSQTFAIVASGSSPRLNFVVKSAPPPNCALLCRVPEGARTLLRDFPAVQLSGSVLGSCSGANSLKGGDDVTLFSSTKDTFFIQTFVVVLVTNPCPTATFTVVAVDEGVESDPKVIDIKSNGVGQQCVPFKKAIRPSEPISFGADQFVSAQGPFSVTLLKTDPSFVLQSNGASLSRTSLTSTSNLVFVGDRSVQLVLMVEASNPPWTGFCPLIFTIDQSTSPIKTLAPTPETTSTPTTPATYQPETLSPVSAGEEKPFNFTLLVFFLIVVLIVTYFFRKSIFRAFSKSGPAGRRYGVAVSEEI